MKGPFTDLIVWQKAMELVRAVYALSKAFPADERYALTDQIRRAAVSIPSNIAEGYGRSSNADYGHFLAIARGSLYEVMTQVQVASLPLQQQEVCRLMLKNPLITAVQIAELQKVRVNTIEKRIAVLRKKGAIVREGGTRGIWKVLWHL